MKAVRMHSRGGPEALVYEDAPVPTIAEGEALIRVRAAGITPTEFTWGSTFTTPDRKSRLPIIPSFDVAGVVEKAAPDATGPSPGEAVYGLLDFWKDGAAAEYVAAKASDLAPKPDSLNFVQAAAVPLSGLTAWQSLFDQGKVDQGDRVLIHGAGGGVGTFAVQLAKWKGARITATCSKSSAPLARELGAAEVIDYERMSFEEAGDFDMVLDTVGGDTLERSWGVLRKGGILVTIAGDAPDEKVSAYGVHGVSLLVQANRAELVEMARLIDQGELRPVVSGVYDLPDARRAYERGLAGHSRGKLVLRVNNQ